MAVERRTDVGSKRWRPVFVVWELTLACDQPCTHCGSRAGVARPRELSTAEALRVVGELAALGTEEVALIGGEAYLHPGFLDIVRAVREAGLRPTMVTGGRGVDEALAAKLGAAGLYSVSVSIDGLEPTHDLMRAAPGSFTAATGAMRRLAAHGVRVTANTNFNRLNAGEVEPLYDLLRSLGAEGWQVQITAPLGRAADRPDMLLQPWDLLELVPRLAAAKERGLAEGLLVMPGNNLGYFGPEETLLRSTTAARQDHWRGCNAGKYLMGIESDGAVKGCPSLQTVPCVGGNVLESPVERVWKETPQLAFARERTVDDLWGFCRTCPFAEPCLGGCSFTAHALFGRPGNNPYCHFRARTLARAGRRERLVPAARAPGTPFDHGLFELVEEPLDAPDERSALRRMVKPRRTGATGLSLPIYGETQ